MKRFETGFRRVYRGFMGLRNAVRVVAELR